MPKAYYQWEVSVWTMVYHKQDQVWVWSHPSILAIRVRAETEEDARAQVSQTLRPEYIDEKNGIKVTAQSIQHVYCLGRMKKVTEWKVTNKDQVPTDYRWR